jgi:hypothetical protein
VAEELIGAIDEVNRHGISIPGSAHFILLAGLDDAADEAEADDDARRETPVKRRRGYRVP